MKILSSIVNMQIQRTVFIIALLLLVTGLGSCSYFSKNKLDIDLSKLPAAKVTLKPYDVALFSCDTSKLAEELIRIQPEYAYFLGSNPTKVANLQQIRKFVTDPNLRKLYDKTRKTFPDATQIESKLSIAGRRFLYYFPEQELPEFYSYISGVYYESAVLADQNAVVIGLDCYIGSSDEIYTQMGIPLYLSERMTPDYIVKDAFSAIYQQKISLNGSSATILQEMIEAGKRLYFIESMQADIPGNILLGYRESQFKWAVENQAEVWAYLVSEQLLYKNDFMMFKKLFGDGPFTREFSEEAPARLGEFIGWQIVKAFMERNSEVKLNELVQLTDYQRILTDSRYKPKK
ncbi:MAG: hypothetical protein ACOYN5_12805 [Bacteroidales bacterium]